VFWVLFLVWLLFWVLFGLGLGCFLGILLGVCWGIFGCCVCVGFGVRVTRVLGWYQKLGVENASFCRFSRAFKYFVLKLSFCLCKLFKFWVVCFF